MKKANWLHLAGIVLTVVVVAAGCAKKEESMVSEPAAAPAVRAPVVVTENIAGASLKLRETMGNGGAISFTESGGSVKIVAHIIGAPPGTHGLHIHEIGDCSSEDFKSAGGHFNPTGAPHGGPEDAERHAGDLGNIEIGENGSGHLELESDLISVGGGENSIIGRGVILHEKMDDLVSQPTGAAGSRLACGVIAPSPGV